MTVQINTPEKMTLTPNPAFIRAAPAEARKKWHDALVECPHPQGRKQMLDDHTGGRCCLMVGHEAFGGTDETRNETLPLGNSPFVRALSPSPGPIVNPLIAVAVDHNRLVQASACNDRLGLSFAQIAQLVYPEAYEGEQPWTT